MPDAEVDFPGGWGCGRPEDPAVFEPPFPASRDHCLGASEVGVSAGSRAPRFRPQQCGPRCVGDQQWGR